MDSAPSAACREGAHDVSLSLAASEEICCPIWDLGFGLREIYQCLGAGFRDPKSLRDKAVKTAGAFSPLVLVNQPRQFQKGANPFGGPGFLRQRGR